MRINMYKALHLRINKYKTKEYNLASEIKGGYFMQLQMTDLIWLKLWLPLLLSFDTVWVPFFIESLPIFIEKNLSKIYWLIE